MSSNDIIFNEIRFQRTQCVVMTLVLAKKLAYYMHVAGIIGVSKRDQNFHNDLGRLMDQDHAANLPYRSSVVINKEFGMPGKAFFERARNHGHSIPYDDDAEYMFWIEQLKKLGIFHEDIVNDS